MKKTEKTALTAALFAAALNLVPTGECDTAIAAGTNDYEPSVTARMTYPAYGAAPAWTTEPTKTTVDPMETMQPVYGPPPISRQDLGDLDRDGKVTAFDLVLLRQKFYQTDLSTNDYLRGDVNEDGGLSIADVVMLQKYLLGQIDSLGYDSVIDPSEPPETELTRVTTMPFAPVYGPPWVISSLYPELFGGDETTTTTVDELSSMN